MSLFIDIARVKDVLPIGLYRVLHDRELPSGVRDEVIIRGVPLPEVFQLLPANHFSRLNYSWQWFWKNINPNMTNLQWRKLLQCHRAFTNNNGFECGEGHGPFRDYVNNRDLNAKEDPKIEAILCGGAIITGIETTYLGKPHLLVSTLDGNNPPPPLLDIPYYYFYEAVSVSPDGTTRSFPTSSGPEYVPIIAREPMYFPMSGLVKL